MESLQGIKDPRAALRLHSLLTAAGLENVELEMIRLPLCGWPSGMLPPPFMTCEVARKIKLQLAGVGSSNLSLFAGEKEAEIGNVVRTNISETLESLAILPFTKRLNVSIDDVKSLVANATADATNPALKPYFSL